MKLITVLGTALALLLAARPDRAQSPARPDSTAASNRYRFRLLGVYDATSGEPVEGVEVADFLNGTSSLTTKTGTVSLFFLPDGGALVRLRKIGYETQTLAVSIAPTDTLPITVVLNHATSLPAVIVRDSAPKFVPPGLRAFEEHRKLGFGHFLTDTLFRKYESSTAEFYQGAEIPAQYNSTGSACGVLVLWSRTK